jgi:hypothetical protein
MTNLSSSTVSTPSIDTHRQVLPGVAQGPYRLSTCGTRKCDPLDELLADIIEMLLCADEDAVDDKKAA